MPHVNSLVHSIGNVGSVLYEPDYGPLSPDGYYPILWIERSQKRSQQKKRWDLCQRASQAVSGTIYSNRSTGLSACGKRIYNRTRAALCRQQACPHCWGSRLPRIKTPLTLRVANMHLEKDWYALPVTFLLHNVHPDKLGEYIDVLTAACTRIGSLVPLANALGSALSKEFTYDGRVFPHAHALYLFKTRDEAERAQSRVAALFIEAVDPSYRPSVWIGALIPGSDREHLKNYCAYITKLPPVSMLEALLANQDHYRIVYEALNSRRPGGTRTQLVNLTGVFSSRRKMTAARHRALPRATRIRQFSEAGE